MWELFLYNYLQELPPPEIHLYAQCGYEVQVHKEVFSQTKKMSEILSLAANAGDKIEIRINTLNKEELKSVVHYLYHGEVLEKDKKHITFETLAKVFGFHEIFHKLEPSVETSKPTTNENDKNSDENDDFPSIKEIPYTWTHDIEIIKWAIKKGESFDKYSFTDTEFLKRMPGRSVQSIEQRFYDEILPNIQKTYNRLLSKSDREEFQKFYGTFKSNKNTVSLKPNTPSNNSSYTAGHYTQIEDESIIRWVIQNQKANKRAMWEALIEAKILPGRSYESINKRFYTNILPQIQNIRFSSLLSQADKDRLRLYGKGVRQLERKRELKRLSKMKKDAKNNKM